VYVATIIYITLVIKEIIMSNINDVLISTYNTNLNVLSQQMGSKLRTTVRLENQGGEKAFFDAIGSVDAVAKASRYPDTPIVNTPFSRRMALLKEAHIGDLVDTTDNLKTAVSIDARIPMMQAYALGRTIDSAVLEAMFADAPSGVDGSTPVAFPTTQEIPVDLSGASEGLTINKLIEAKKLFWLGDVDLDNPTNAMHIAVTGFEMRNLLQTTEVTSSDYNTVKALVQGEINTFMGMTFHITNLIDVSGSVASCPVWVESGVVLNLPKDITGSIDKRPDKSNATQLYAQVAYGTVRLEEEKVVKIYADQSA
jgi:hypothetical protein